MTRTTHRTATRTAVLAAVGAAGWVGTAWLAARLCDRHRRATYAQAQRRMYDCVDEVEVSARASERRRLAQRLLPALAAILDRVVASEEAVKAVNDCLTLVTDATSIADLTGAAPSPVQDPA